MNISSYYHIDQGVKNYDIDSLPNDGTCDVVAQECVSDARMERLKSVTTGLMAAGTTLALLCVAYAVGKVSALLVGIAFLPLMIIPPLYALLMLVGGIGAGIAFAKVTIKPSGMKFMDQAKAHWNNANFYSEQATAARFRQAALAKA